MPIYYLDTSALLKRYRTENGTRVPDALFTARTRSELLITSHFTAVEVVSGRQAVCHLHGVIEGFARPQEVDTEAERKAEG